MSPKYIAVSTPGLQKAALAELSAVAPDIVKAGEFEQGAFMIETSRVALELLPALVRANPIFIKHIMPVQATLRLTLRAAQDLPSLQCAAQECAAQELNAISSGDYFTVQCRRVGHDVGHGYDYTAKDVEVYVGNAFETAGAIPVFYDKDLRPVRGSDPAIDPYPDSELVLQDWHKVVFLYLYHNTAYLGASTIGLSLNEHCDENRIFARRSRDVCRAEFKLLEALRKFALELPPGRALDLGAAPGGWTKVLASLGMQVTAVDPAELDSRVASLPNVHHVRQLAEQYTPEGDYDLLVNDMNLPAARSAALMLHAAARLKPGAPAIMTLKQLGHHPQQVLERTLPALREGFDVLNARCLFHNRLEVTLLLQRRCYCNAAATAASEMNR